MHLLRSCLLPLLLLTAAFLCGCQTVGIGLSGEKIPFPVADGAFALRMMNQDNQQRLEVKTKDGSVTILIDREDFGTATSYRYGGSTIIQLACTPFPGQFIPMATFQYFRMTTVGDEIRLTPFDTFSPASRARITEVMGPDVWYQPKSSNGEGEDVKIAMSYLRVSDQGALAKFEQLLADPAMFPADKMDGKLKPWTAADEAAWRKK